MPIPLPSSQIADDLKQRMRAGEYPPGSQLPSYPALAARYGVHRSTIARVIAGMQETGWIIGIPGRGTFVPESLPESES